MPYTWKHVIFNKGGKSWAGKGLFPADQNANIGHCKTDDDAGSYIQ